jgi:hypothetical protein
MMPRRRESGGDGLLLVAAGDLDAAGLGGLVHRDGQGEHAGGVVGGDVLGVEGLAEEDLPGETLDR